LHIQKWNIPLNEFFQNNEIENFYTIILKSAAGRIESLIGPHLARRPLFAHHWPSVIARSLPKGVKQKMRAQIKTQCKLARSVKAKKA